MLYRFISSNYTDIFAYASAVVAALWLYAVRQQLAQMPAFVAGYLTAVPPEYGIAVASFAGALLLGKYICQDGTAQIIDTINEEKASLERVVKKRNLTVTELKEKAAALASDISVLHNRIKDMEENSPKAQLSSLRIKMRTAEEDSKSALSVLLKNLQTRLAMIMDVNDSQLLFAADVLRQEIDLIENEIKRGERTYYELCLKIVDINEKIFELKEIALAVKVESKASDGTAVEAWLNFIRVNDNDDQDAVDRSFKFFKVAFHPDRFPSDSLKAEATKYFQHSINMHNNIKKMDN
ncbi:MAG: hypothetical protein OEV89_07330 [Desulfobulbaceae bacterium]|nr:hypothetical protein [Desulfobulbaceae bacterium]HIJ90564.1 hypothetical protein [Deltaproteobacteria bacterium]